MRGVLSAFALVAVAACVPEAPPGAAGPAETAAQAGPLDSSRPADRQMIAYGEAHPECRLWSNWEKLCSRTGPGRDVRCVADPDRPVEPSAPFCVRRNLSNPSWVLDDDERASRLRFCLEPRTVPGGGDGEPNTGTRICARYDPQRPFNGRRVGAWMHPSCQGLNEAETGRPICVRGGDAVAGIPDCETLAAEGHENPRLLTCSAWSGPSSCHAAPVRAGRSLRGENVTFGSPDPDVAAAHGLFCQIIETEN